MACSGDTPDLSANHDAEIISILVVFTVLALIAYVLRVMSRRMKRVPIGIDDVLLTIALVRCAVMTKK